MPHGRGRRTARIASRSLAGEAARAARVRHGRPGDPLDGDTKLHRARAIRRTLEDLGPLYIKVGQILATRPDFVPDYIRDELACLNDRADAVPFSRFEPVLAAELGSDWRTLFREIQTEQPLGTASLAQVYKAVNAQGIQCAIKVQRPGAEEAVLGDMAVTRTVARLIAKVFPHFSEVVDIAAMLEVLFTVMRDELDFTREARNMREGRRIARDFKRIRVPKPLLVTPRVLVQTYAEGVPINQLKEDSLSEKQRKKLAYELIEFMFRSYFTERFFHADPHPGNILVGSDGKAHVIDWGMVGRIDRDTSVAVLGTFLAMARNDGTALAKQWVNLGTATPWSNVSAFTRDVSRVVPRWTDASLEELNFGVALMTLLRYSSSRGIQITPLTSVAGKSVTNIEGSVRCLYPRLKLSTAVRRVLKDIMRDLLLETFSGEQAAQVGLHVLTLMTQGPAQLQAALGDVSDRQFAVQARTNVGDPIGHGGRHRAGARIGPLTIAAAGASLQAGRRGRAMFASAGKRRREPQD
ncbi:ABC1 kinase family protein [Streptomyces sp. NRRL S-1521]|uniref:ABC1 kinase family protein n=1 Tax=Streptomyces sp. NRRL S-1521 TaxID=1609100 RepID=UPI000746E111|nr:AarF/UbiB family protein [Streptomyces sp. NRRL S-1521]KUL53149.1 ubiquinone biosynthesis monooxygenase UbiB [Streptomyces sp. NRRL S-1521]